MILSRPAISVACGVLGLCFSLAGPLLAEPPAGVPQPPIPLELAPRLGLPFQDNAVLQQKIPLPVWGTSLPGASVTVAFGGQSKTATADVDGRWKVVLEPMNAVTLKSVNDAPEGMSMTVTCAKDGERAVATIRNLLMGEVWLCAGQSNMAGAMRVPVADADYPALRQLVSPKPEWVVCSPENAAAFKRVCFFFARRVQRDALVPLGIINAAVGGSRIESWLNEPPSAQGDHFKNLVGPIAGYGIRGLIWYQGESNADDRRGYQPKLESLIKGWRTAWSQAASREADGPRSPFSVYFVQLPGIGVSATDDPAMGDGRAEIRQACVEALALENTGMAITIDIGAVNEHPPNKFDTGERLARLALHRDYGFDDLLPSGPVYKIHVVEGSAIRVRFDYAGSGLMVAEKTGMEPPVPLPEKSPGWLSIQSRDGAWHWADGRIEGADLVVSSADVKEPVAVRYAYTNHPTPPLLYNSAGLPASPFTTGGYGPELQAKRSTPKRAP